MTYSATLLQAISHFDAINAQDPRTQEGEPQELLYAKRMTAWLNRLDPDASEVMQLAARAQHIRRWAIERKEYPDGPVGYKQWRAALTQLHVEAALGIMQEVGYAPDVQARVKSLMRKERLKLDAESQLLEDVVCLVFLENYFATFSAKHESAKVIDILRKTWAKMSSRAHEHALVLPMPPAARGLVEQALASEDR